MSNDFSSYAVNRRHICMASGFERKPARKVGRKLSVSIRTWKPTESLWNQLNELRQTRYDCRGCRHPRRLVEIIPYDIRSRCNDVLRWKSEGQRRLGANIYRCVGLAPTRNVFSPLITPDDVFSSIRVTDNNAHVLYDCELQKHTHLCVCVCVRGARVNYSQNLCDIRV